LENEALDSQDDYSLFEVFFFFGERGLFKKRKTERMPYDHPAFPFLNKIPKI
jgi:hypothetical protein